MCYINALDNTFAFQVIVKLHPTTPPPLPPSKGIRKFCLWNPKSGKTLFVKSGILDLGIRNTAQRIRNPTKDWNPVSKFHWLEVESGIHGMESRIQDCLGFTLTWGDTQLFRQIRAGIIISRCWICLNRFLWFLEQSPNSLIIGKSTLMTSLCLGLSEKVHLEKYTVATFLKNQMAHGVEEFPVVGERRTQKIRKNLSE